MNQVISNKTYDVFSSLNYYPASALILEILKETLALMKGSQGWIYIPGKATQRAAGALLYDLMQVASLGRNEWLYRPLRPAAFTKKVVGYKTFKKVFDGFKYQGWLEIKPGYFVRSKDGSGDGEGEATRFRPTAAFLDFMAAKSITPQNYRPHFQLDGQASNDVRDFVWVRASKKGDWRNPIKGKLLPVDSTCPIVRTLSNQIYRINDYMERQDFEGCTVDGFYRLFNQGDQPDFAFNKGGRLYAFGDFQRMKREDRPNIRINGEPVVEVDVGASHLTMYHALVGHPLHTGFDPYDVPGLPRGVVKSFVVLTLGSGKIQTRWPASTIADCLEDYKIDLRGYKISDVRRAVVGYLSALGLLIGSNVTWADLQYLESRGLIAAIETLAFQYDVPALPLHDAVIVPASKQELAARVMKEAFQQHAGVSVRVSVK